MRKIVAHAPARIDLAGGTLDIWPLPLIVPPPATTVNVALDLPATATWTPSDDGAIRLHSSDRRAEERHASIDALRESLGRGGGPLRLLARAVEAVEPPGGFTLGTEARGPAGAGLGGSSTLLVAVLATLFRAAGKPATTETIRPLAQDLETWVIGGPTGYQDYYPALEGGCLALVGRPGGIDVEHLPVDLGALERRLLLVFTGAPRRSAITNWGAMRAYLDGERATVEALHEIAEIARDVRARLRAGDLDGALDATVAEGLVRRRLAAGVATPTTEAVDDAARRAGARGTKILGAGGGGCVLVVLPDAAVAPRVSEAVAKIEGCTLLPVRLVERGLAVSEYP
jgi:D-glycero-alpha-D-manno-heptose-7-phosphate kinase